MSADRLSFLWLFFGAMVALGCGSAHAQNTASIPSASVKEGELFLEYRASFGQNDAGAADPFTHRIHFNYAPTDDIRLMAFIEQRKIGDGPLRTRRFSPNLFTQFVGTKNWDLAVRWQGDIPLQNGVPGRARIGLLNTWRTGPWEFRSNIYFGKEIGDNAPGGFVFETREEALIEVADGRAVGVQVFNNFVSTRNFNNFDNQRHQAGPFLRAKIGKRVRVDLGALFGLSQAATDAELRLFAGYSF